MADTRFTALGMSGSGKTCYVLGMYYKMCVGANGFTLTTTNQDASKLEDWMDRLDDETGPDRFPSGTTLTEVTDYSFKLNYQNTGIMSFDWVDYGGGTLKARENNAGAYNRFNEAIDASTAIYIFIDGELLCDENEQTRIKNVNRKCARVINPYITSYLEGHRAMLPPIVFVVTKADLCAPYLKPDEIDSIIKECFSSVFGDEQLVYITAVTLGNNISDDNYSGDVDPINIHIPFLIGIYHQFLNYCLLLKNEIDEEENKSRKVISASESEIKYQNSKWFFTNQSKIEECRKQINEANDNINSNREMLNKYRRLLMAVTGELLKYSGSGGGFNKYLNGEKNDFTFDEISAI